MDGRMLMISAHEPDDEGRVYAHFYDKDSQGELGSLLLEWRCRPGHPLIAATLDCHSCEVYAILVTIISLFALDDKCGHLSRELNAHDVQALTDLIGWLRAPT